MASSGLFGMYIFAAHFGGLAHLVERKHGMFEVTGSIPVSSTLFLLFSLSVDQVLDGRIRKQRF